MSAEPRTARARLIDIREAIEGILSATATLDFDDYQRNWTVRRAVERGLEIISEASRHVSDDIKRAHPEVPWRQIAGIGNVLRHEYQRVEDRLIWNIVTRQLTMIEAAVQAALNGLPGPSEP